MHWLSMIAGFDIVLLMNLSHFVCRRLLNDLFIIANVCNIRPIFEIVRAVIYCTTLGLHYYHYVSPSINLLPVSEMFITHDIFLSHFAYICMSTLPKH